MAEQLTLLSVENLINSASSKLNDIKYESKENRAMLDEILENDTEYQKILQEFNKISKLKKIAKQKVMNRQEPISLNEKIKNGNSQIKELKSALSDYLTQYVQLSGSNQIELKDGVIRQILYSAKLVKSI